MELRTIFLGVCSLLIFSFLETLLAFPYGFKRLKKGGVQISILYDVHIEAPGTTVDEMEILSYKQAKRKLHPSERRFLTALERLNRSNKTAVVWEFRTVGRPLTAHFMGIGPRLIKQEFKNISFSHADNNRVSYRSIFNKSEPNITGATFQNPLPFVTAKKHAIKKHSGRAVWQAYKNLCSKVKRELYNEYREHYYAPDTMEFMPTLAYDQIADLEILAEVLSCKRQNIIVYCGGYHVERIAHFLEVHADFEVMSKEGGQYFTEISPALLSFLDKEPLSVNRMKKAIQPSVPKKNAVTFDLMSGGLQFLTFEPFFSTLRSI